jgi:hypothetical protein
MTTPNLTRAVLPALLLSLVVGAACPAAPAAGKRTDLVTAKLVADVDAATPGKSFTLGVRLAMAPAGIPTGSTPASRASRRRSS